MSTAALDPLFFARVERKDHGFIADCAGHVDGVVLLGRLIAPPWAHEPHPFPEFADADLVEAARRAKIDHITDPDTWPLVEAKHRENRDGNRRYVRMAAAEIVPLPLTPAVLKDSARRQAFVRASIGDQQQPVVPAAPYFRFESLADPWLAINLACIETLVDLQGGLPVSAFIVCTKDALASGALELAVPRYAAILPPGSLTFVGVADLRPDEDDSYLLTRYLCAVEAFAVSGLAPIADRVGDFGPAAITFGARGCARGTRFYRHTPKGAVSEQRRNGPPKSKWLAYRTAQRLSVVEAVARLERGSIHPCPLPLLCVTLRIGTDTVDVRLHDAHLHRHELTLAAGRSRADQADFWRALGLKRLGRWAQAIDDAAALSDAA